MRWLEIEPAHGRLLEGEKKDVYYQSSTEIIRVVTQA